MQRALFDKSRLFCKLFGASQIGVQASQLIELLSGRSCLACTQSHAADARIDVSAQQSFNAHATSLQGIMCIAIE